MTTPGKRLLIVDDEPDLTYAFRLGLERGGMGVTVFNDPLEALEDLKGHGYDLVILDIRMPRMSGFDLYREIRKHDGDTPIAFMTAFEIHLGEFEKMFPDIKPKALLKKPITIAEMARRVHEMLDESDEVAANQTALI